MGIVLVYFNPSPQKRLFLRFLPYCFATPRNATGHGKGEVDARFAAVAVFSTPPSFGHLPYILLCKTQRRRGYLILLLSLFFNPSIFLTPYGHSPYMAVPHRGRGLKSGLFPYAVFAPRNAAGHGRGEVKISFR